MRAFGKRSLSALTASTSSSPEHAALELEVVEAVARLRGFSEAHDGLGRQRRFVPQTQPVVGLFGRARVVEIGARAVADVEQVAERFDFVALLAFAQQRRHRHAEKLPEQIEQGAFQRRDRVHRGTQIEGLQAAAAGIAFAEAFAHDVEDALIVAQRLAHDEGMRFFQCLPDGFAARHFADAGIARAVGEHDDVAGEVGGVGTAQIE